MPSKARQSGRLPFVMGIHLDIVLSFAVVIHHHLCFLPVTFTGREDNGTGVFQHGNEVGNHDSLREEVFCRTEKLGALETPTIPVLVVITAVTGPQGQVSVLQTEGRFDGTGDVFHPRLTIVVCLAPSLWQAVVQERLCRERQRGAKQEKKKYWSAHELHLSYGKVLRNLTLEVLEIQFNLSHLSIDVAIGNNGLGTLDETTLKIYAV